MLKKMLFSAAPVYLPQGIAIIRMILGLFLIYHGKEVFDQGLMKEYAAWDAFSGMDGRLMVYTGKSMELVAGILFLFGLCTRLGALLTIGTFSVITFFVGTGKFWYQDQHPFMFVLLGILFMFSGPGAWSADALIARRKRP